MANESVNRISQFPTRTSPADQPIRPLPAREALYFAAGAQKKDLESIAMPGKNPYGQISPNVTTTIRGIKLPSLYA